MPLTLHVDGPRWRRHLRSMVEVSPTIVPVAKGNGYGFGVGRLARRAEWLGSDTIAVGTYAEVAEVADRFHGDVLVLEPWRPFLNTAVLDPKRLVHTVGRPEDLQALGHSAGNTARVVLEALTSMHRHGFAAEALADTDPQGVHVEGLALHLPLGSGHVAEVERWLANRLGATRLFVSHVTAAELVELSGRHPEVEFRPRIGTDLWLGDRKALSARATVLDAHPVRKGDRVGYRQRRISKDGHVLVVSGGTAHGIAMEAPAAASSSRQRAVSVAKGGLEAAGRARSPFTVDGKQRWFVEPPHMQVSMIFVPGDASCPQPGDEVDVQVRFTTTVFDAVEISGD